MTTARIPSRSPASSRCASSAPSWPTFSACRTARNTAAHLLDEAIHLASAFQLAGYPHVVGTLWTIYDTIAVDVARAFYAGLETQRQALDVSQSAQALHHSVRDLRDNRNLASVPSQWAAYLHTGM